MNLNLSYRSPTLEFDVFLDSFFLFEIVFNFFLGFEQHGVSLIQARACMKPALATHGQPLTRSLCCQMIDKSLLCHVPSDASVCIDMNTNANGR